MFSAFTAVMSERTLGYRTARLGRLGFVIAAVTALLCGHSTRAHARTGDSLRFEPNVGQFDGRVSYLARGRSFALFLTPGGATLVLERPHDAPPDDAPPGGGVEADARAVVAMTLRGAASVRPLGLAQLPGQSNYFAGQERAQWRTGVDNYARVRYESVLPGVDLEFYGTEGRELEYDFVLAAGVSPSLVLVDFDGVSSIEVSPDGSARLRLSDGSVLTKRPPIAYQTRGQRRIPVSVKYELRSGGLGFVVGAHDHSLPLVIDPVLTYSSYFGGSSYDEVTGVAADSAGNTYLVGYTASTLFPTYAPQQPTHGGGSYDAFVVKLDATGQNRIYSTYLGGSGPDMAYAVASDALGNAYVAGLTASTNFPVLNALQATLAGAQDAFVTKLNPSGSALSYSTYLGGALDDYARGIAVSGAGAAYLVGTTFSANFPKVAALQSSLSGTYDAFVTQLAPGGTGLVYSTYLGGSGTEYGNAIALDTSGSAYVVGSTTSSNFPITNAHQPAHAGGSNDAFLCKLNLSGSAFVFSTYLGGSGSDEANGVTVTLGTAVVVGSTLSANFPLALAKQAVPGGNNHTDAFVTRFDPSGSALIYSTYLGGSGNESAAAVASDAFGDAYIVGSTDSSDLPVENPIAGQETYRGGVDAFVAAITPTGSRFVYTSYLGGTGEDRAAGVTFSNGTTQIVGNTRSTDFPKVTPIINGLVGAQDAFVVKIPGIEPAGAPALGNHWFAFGAGLLLSIAMLFVNARRSAGCRSAR
jgi:hypothetical protein